MVNAIALGYLRVLKHLNRTVLWVLAGLMLVMTIAISVQILVRFTSSFPTLRVSAPWTEELARYAMIWLIFLGMAVGLRHRSLIAVTYFVEKLPQAAGRGLQYMALLISFLFLGLLVKLGLQSVHYGTVELSPVLRIPKSWVYWAMPAGAVLGALNIVASILENHLRGGDIRRPDSALSAED